MPETQSRLPLDEAHLDTLAYLIETGKCALVLGPQLSRITENDRKVPLRQKLARELAEELAKTPGMAIPDPDDLSLVCTAYQKHFNGSRLTLEHKVGSFFRRFNDPEEVLRQVAHLPFRVILSTAQDNLLQSAFKKEGKLWQEGHYRVGETQVDNYDESSHLPYIYQLFGKVLEKDVDRLVLTQQDQMRYVDSMQGVGRETRLPPALLRAMQDCKGFLFLGFDFEDWYLRVLLHILHFVRDEQAVFGLHQSKPDRPCPHKSPCIIPTNISSTSSREPTPSIWSRPCARVLTKNPLIRRGNNLP
ncbi:MAG: SIR2 family protein [Lewinellaceae bacterium]|nr:SIR2 family protein [Lewinellaceae bacterium]